MRLLLYVVLFFLFYTIVKIFIRTFRSPSNKENNQRKGFRAGSKYENVEEAEFKEIESNKKVKKEE